MRKTLAVAAIAAGIGAFALAGAAQAAPTGNSGAHSAPLGLVNVDASDAAHWQICGQNVFTISDQQNCNNKDHVGHGPQSGASSDGVALGNLDASSAAHWQICGQNVGVLSNGQLCDNHDHTGK
ncbi:MAG TPA: hypothetical protein VE172_20555 [Stackebrandtia sp.]|jgi:hypothetical protein|uniref:hypothetical protein n=1 Tax=Stackebrandtia sp. TaxID=2023065 RepID=UPI002D4062F5|nr:hypothetical protein [Stackebrandtia sp.]HZE41198.1 hypothetical protein [Stackebrandtia sp.]